MTESKTIQSILTKYDGVVAEFTPEMIAKGESHETVAFLATEAVAAALGLQFDDVRQAVLNRGEHLLFAGGHDGGYLVTNDGSKASMAAEEAERKKKSFTFVDKRKEEPVAEKPAAPAAEAPRPLPEKKKLSPSEIEAAMAFHYAEGRTEATVHEVYDFGFPMWAFTGGKPNCCLVRPIRRPAVSAGGVIMNTDEKRGTLGTSAFCYLVLAVGELVQDKVDPFMDVEPGDIVILRNAMLEPLDDTLNTLSIHRSHLLAKVDVVGN